MVPELDQRRFAQVRVAGAGVVDVRRVDECRAGHVPGARLMPLPVLGARAHGLPTGAPVNMTCQPGALSAQATRLLRGAGVEALDVLGGNPAWIPAGRPVEHSVGTGATR